MKKIFKTFISFISIMSLLFAFTACNGNGDNIGEHTHDLTYHAMVQATCTETGNVEYYNCTICGSNFSDSLGENAIIDVVIQFSHDLTYHARVEATVTENGNIEFWSCNDCNNNYADENATLLIDANAINLPKLPYSKVDSESNVSASGSYMLFGSYPQTDVTITMSTALSSHVVNKHPPAKRVVFHFRV